MSGRELVSALPALARDAALEELLVLSTCNRVEVCVVSSRPPEAVAGEVTAWLASRGRVSEARMASGVTVRSGAAAVQHVFRVASGLESMVLGESEITAQLKDAYQAAQVAGTLGPRLHRLIQKSFHSAKLVRSRTRIAEGTASIGAVVALLARRLYGDRLPECRVLLWGAGKAAATTARHLLKQGIGQLWIVNRTAERAQELAELCAGGWVSWEQATARLASVDIAVVCTQAPHYVLDAGDLEAVLRHRPAGRPLCIVDLSVPRNVDPAIARQANVRLYNIDDLRQLAEQALQERRQEARRCDPILEEQASRFWQWWVEEQQREGVMACPANGS